MDLPTAVYLLNRSGAYNMYAHCLLQRYQHLEQAAPVVGEMMEIKKVLSKYVGPPKNIRCAVRSAIIFEPMGIMRSPAYGHVGHAMGNLFSV